MNKIKKVEFGKIAKLHEELSSNIDEYNAFVVELNERIESAILGFEKVHGDRIVSLEADILSTSAALEKLSSDQVKNMEEYMSNRTEKWHDTDSGLEFQNWLDSWQTFNSDIQITPSFDAFSGVEIPLEEGISLPPAKK